jgi:hypothetical protein
MNDLKRFKRNMQDGAYITNQWSCFLKIDTALVVASQKAMSLSG